MNIFHRSCALVVIFFLSGCAGAGTPPPSATPAPSATPTETSTPSPTATQMPTPTSTFEPSWYQPVDPSLGLLKYKYAEVVNKRARLYASLQDALAGNGNFGYLPKFPAYLAYTTTETHDGVTYYFLPVNYDWIRGDDLLLLTPSNFAGLILTRDVSYRFGWVLADSVSLDLSGTSVKDYKRYQVVHQFPESGQKPGYIAVGANEWLPVASVTLVDPAVPAEAGPNTCRFIYADLATQTLSVYDNCKLIFATLISSGKNSWTFEGHFAVQNKVEYGSITPPEWSTSEYYIQAVPFFMSYEGSFGFHAAYWHDSFGSATSHGCINLSPADAKWLYDWASIGERVIISAGK